MLGEEGKPVVLREGASSRDMRAFRDGGMLMLAGGDEAGQNLTFLLDRHCAAEAQKK